MWLRASGLVPKFRTSFLGVLFPKRSLEQSDKATKSHYSSLAELDICTTHSKGLPSIIIPLPSRKERCKFILRPLGNSLQDLLEAVQVEDRGIDFISAYTLDGCRIAGTTSIENLFRDSFTLRINEISYVVNPPRTDSPIVNDDEAALADVKILVNRLYECLAASEHQLKQERKLLEKIESVKSELRPLQSLKDEVARQSHRKTTVLGWTGLGLMGVQFGILARLTWWEYSWDIMEPVTYFVTYGTSVAVYAYFMVTKQDYYLPDVRDREFLKAFWKGAKRVNLDLEKYNLLRNTLRDYQENLKKLKDPSQSGPVDESCDDCVQLKEREERRRKDEF